MGVCENGHTSNAKFCPECGSKVLAAPQTGTWCTDCGCQSGANFCPQCGKKKGAPPTKTPSFCERCGLESAAKFCPGCGNQKVAVGATSPPSTVRTTPSSPSSPSPTPGHLNVNIQAPASGNKKQVLCAACGQFITGRVLLAVEDTWHPACFTCVHCLKPQEGCPFYVQDDNIYCEKDYNDIFALKCYGCKAIVDGQYLRVPTLNQIFHPNCLVCSTCKEPLKSKTFFCDDNSDEILCRKDYEERKTTTKCAHCKDFITGSVVMADGKKYHNKCYLILNPLSVEEVKRKKSLKQKELEEEEIPDEKEEEKVSLSVPPEEPPKPSVEMKRPTANTISTNPNTPAAAAATRTNTIAHANNNNSHATATSTPHTNANTSSTTHTPHVTPATGANTANTANNDAKTTGDTSTTNTNNTAADTTDTPPDTADTTTTTPADDTRAPAVSQATPAKQDPPAATTEASSPPSVAAAPRPSTFGTKPNGLSSPLAASSVGQSFLGPSKIDTKPQQMPPRQTQSAPKETASPTNQAASGAAVDDLSGPRAANKTLSAAQKMNQMIESEDAIPYIMHGLKYVLHSQADDNEVFVPDYRKKEMYKLVTMDKKYDFQHYAPSVFRCIRNLFGITQQLFYKSLVEVGITGGKLGDGKSGMLFFYSADRRFVIKTVTRAEIFFFKSILRNYLTHVVKNKHTLLPRFFGAYKLTMPDQRKLRLVVMNNLFETTCKLDEKYDLKGSTRNRWVDTEKHGKGGVLKDLNFTDAIYLGTQQKRAVMAQLKKDTQWLVEENVMDQSLLIGIHNAGQKVTSEKDYRPVDMADVNKALTVRVKGLTDLDSCYQKFKGGLVSMCDDPTSDHHLSHIYFFGIIDILQEFNAKKRMESTYKCIRYNKKAISAVSSKAYATRFLDYMDQCIK